MIVNIIIGKTSNLSCELSKVLDNPLLIDSKYIKDQLVKVEWDKYEVVNFIFNQFQKSTKLYDIEHSEDYIYRAINTTSIALDYINEHNLSVHKIIYTSSSSVYGDNTSCSESDKLSPLSLHASLKVANERLIELFCNQKNIDYTIARIFNMYGGNDSFSIISKVLDAYENSTDLCLINNGLSIRDYIHIDDVSKIYIKLLVTKDIPIINVGTGNGVSLLYLLNSLKTFNINIGTQNIFKKELMLSTSNNTMLFKNLGFNTFIKVEDYLAQVMRVSYCEK